MLGRKRRWPDRLRRQGQPPIHPGHRDTRACSRHYATDHDRPLAPALVTSANGAFTATWGATDNEGVTGYNLRFKKGATGAWSATVTEATASKVFSLARGTWYIDVRARYAADNPSPWRETRVVVPTDDRSYKFTSGTRRLTGSSYYRGTATSTATTGARMTVRFTGSGFYLLGTRGKAYGKLRVTIDGARYTVDTGYYAGKRATSTHYRVTLFSRALANRAHTIVITDLGTSGRKTIAIDGIGLRN